MSKKLIQTIDILKVLRDSPSGISVEELGKIFFGYEFSSKKELEETRDSFIDSFSILLQKSFVCCDVDGNGGIVYTLSFTGEMFLNKQKPTLVS